MKLDADVKGFVAAMAAAEAAAKKLRDSLGGGKMPDPFEPYDEQSKKRKKEAPKEGDEIAGAFARAFSKRLDAAFKSLPKAKVDADSSAAQTKLQEVRSSLSALSEKRIGIDIDAAAALAEVESLKAELDRLAESTDIDVRADATAALTQLDALQRDIDKLAGSNPTVTPDVDSTEAQAKIAELRASLAELQQRYKAGVDLDDGAARAALSSIQGELEKLNATSADPKVRLDSAQALAELRTVQAEMSRVSGQSARIKVDADVAGALSALAMVSAAVLAIPSAATIGIGVGALGAAFAAAGTGAAGFAAVAVPSMGRINEALKQQESSAGGAGGATKSAGQAAADAAAKALQLEQAERRVTDAQKAVKTAQEDLTRARQDAKRANEDLALSVKDAALSEEDAALNVEEARQRLSEVQADPKASELERQRADLNYREAVQHLEDQQVRTKRLQEDKSTADKKGIEGSDQVKSAQDRLLKSQQDLVDAQKQLTLTQLQQKAALDKAGGAAGGAASKFAELSKREQALAKDVQKFKDSYVDWQRSLQPSVFPAIRSGMDIMSTGMKLSTPLVKASAGAIDAFLKKANGELKSAEWKSFFDDLTEQAPRAIDGLGNSTINVADGLKGIIQAFLPYTDDLMTFLEDATGGFKDWGENLKGSPEFEAFVDYVKTNGPKVVEIVKNVAEFGGKVFQVGAGASPALLDFLVGLSEKLGDLDQAQIEAIAKGVAGIVAAVKLGSSLKIVGLLALADVLAKMSPGEIQALAIAIAAVVGATKGYQAFTAISGALGTFSGKASAAGKAADTAKGGIGGLSGVLKGGVIAGTVLGMVEAFDKVGDSLGGLNPDIEKLSKNLATFGKDGKASADVIDQIGPKFGGIIGAFETFGDSASRLASDNPVAGFMDGFTGFIDSNLGLQLDSGRQAIDNLDESLAKAVSDGNAEGAAQAFQKLAKQAVDAGTPVEKLKDLFPQYAQAMDGIPATTGDVGQAIGLLGGKADDSGRQLGEAAQKMSDFKSSLDTFNSATDVAKGAKDLEQAWKDTKSAVADAHGVMDLTPGVVGRQRDAVITARDAFSGLLEKVQANANAQGTLTGKTGDSRDAILTQLEPLSKLAGGNETAKDQVLKLAAAYGISESDAKKAAKGGTDLLEVLAKLKSHDIRIGADTKPAQDELEAFIKRYSNRSLAIAIATKVQATGGIQTASGATLMAGGGFKGGRGGGAPSPTIRSTPTRVGRSNTVFAEAGREAYIPYDSAYRDRAIKILGKVASDFGLQVYSPDAEQQVSTLTDGLSISTDSITSNLDDATRTLDSTLGSAGSLTQSVSKVGTIATQLGATWDTGSTVVGTAVTKVATTMDVGTLKMTASTDKVGTAVSAVADVIAKAASMIASAAAKTGGASAGSTNVPKPAATPFKNQGASAGSVLGYNPNTASGSGMKPGTYTTGDYGDAGFAGGLVGVTSLANTATMSLAQRFGTSSSPSSSSSGSSGSAGTNINVDMSGSTINSETDVYKVAAQFGFEYTSRA